MTTMKGVRETTSTDGLGQRGDILSAPESLLLRLFSSRSDKCKLSCPQYGQAIIYPRKCYYQAQCVLPVFIQSFRFKRILKSKAEDKTLCRILMWLGGLV